MIILSDGTAIILKYVETFSPGFQGQTFNIFMVSGAKVSITDKRDIESFITAMRKFYKENGITDLTK